MRLSNENKPIIIERKFESLISTIKPSLEKGLPVLGTLGGTAPFIGLLGTVLGIIKAFGDLSINSQDTNAVMFALAEALILTGVGLGVAIPAVVAFNFFNRKARAVISHLTVLRNEILNEKQEET